MFVSVVAHRSAVQIILVLTVCASLLLGPNKTFISDVASAQGQNQSSNRQGRPKPGKPEGSLPGIYQFGSGTTFVPQDRMVTRRMGKAMFVRVVVAVTTLGCGLALWGIYNASSERGRAIDRWEVSNAEFKIRVTAYREKAIFTPGAFYVFESAVADADNWHEILTLRTDEPSPIPRERVRFLNDQIAYFFMSKFYAVTTDSGRTWSVWDAERDLAYRQHNLWPSIKEVHVDTGGTGNMVLPPLLGQAGTVPQLHTNDYGRHWHLE